MTDPHEGGGLEIGAVLEKHKKEVEALATAVIGRDAQKVAGALAGLFTAALTGSTALGGFASATVQKAFVAPATKRLMAQIVEYEQEQDRAVFIAKIGEEVELLINQALVQIVHSQHNANAELVEKVGGLPGAFAEFRADFQRGLGVQILGAEPEEPTLPWRAVPSNPDVFMLFDWRSRVAPLCGRDKEVSDLMRWASEGRGARVRFLTGAGGTGKTRLAAEVAQRLRDQGWQAGFVPLKGNPLQTLSEPGRFLIVDYPEDKRSRINELFKQLGMREDSDVPVRVLLLSREPFGKWQREVDATSVTRLCDAREIALSPLEGSRPSELCRGLWKKLEDCRVSGVEIPGISDEAIMAWVKKDEQVHGRPLFLVAAALHSALEPGAAFDLSGADVVKALVRRERARLDRADLCEFKERALARLMALALIGGGLDLVTLRDLADPTLELGLPPRERVLDPLKETPWWRDGRFAPPSPDIVAAVLAHQVFAEADDDALVSEWLWPVLRDAVRSEPAEQVLGRLDRADYDVRCIFGWENSRLSQWLEGVVRGKSSEVGFERASALEPIAFIDGYTGSLLVVTAVVEVLASRAPIDSAGRALLMNNLGKMLSNLGRREDALRATEEAVGVHRQLAEVQPEAFLPALATSLNNLGAMLSNLGRREDALRATEEAVGIRRQLAKTQPETFLASLAISLNNLGNKLSDLGQREEALRATEEAVGFYRQLAKAQPEAFLPALATSLSNLGVSLSDLGRREQALRASEEAVGVHRQLAKAQPEAFLPDLAKSLNNLGNSLSGMGRREQALGATKEAVEIRRQLVKAQPQAFLPDLAGSLNNLGVSLSELGRREQALRATEEVARIYRQLAKAQPQAFLPALATSLNNLGTMLSNLGRREKALRATEEAEGIYQQLAKAQPQAFLPDLAACLNNLGAILSDLGRQEEALRATKEAVGIYRQLVEAQPEAFLPDLAASLHNLGATLSRLGQWEEALRATEEAVRIYRQLAETQPEAFLPDLAMSLNNLGAMLSHLGRREEALRTTEEAERIRRQLAKGQP